MPDNDDRRQYMRWADINWQEMRFTVHASKHYLQTTEAHFAQATQKALQNPVQYPTAKGRIASQAENGEVRKPPICRGKRDNAKNCNPLQNGIMGDTGLEPVTSRV